MSEPRPIIDELRALITRLEGKETEAERREFAYTNLLALTGVLRHEKAKGITQEEKLIEELRAISGDPQRVYHLRSKTGLGLREAHDMYHNRLKPKLEGLQSNGYAERQ